jgi:hypothetical protein
MASVPSAVRQRSTILPTPLVADVIFSERVVNQTKVVPAYGTAHPNTARWPNHKFVFARERPEPEAQDVYDYFYAADRANQDQYNFSFTKADIGGTRFDAVARTYVTLRSAFTPQTPAMGATMPNVPASLFAGDYVLAEKRQTRIGDKELDSLYVAEIHVYVKRCSIRQLGVDSLNGEMLTSTSTLYYASETVIEGVTEPQTITVTGTLTPDATDTMNRVEDSGGFPQFSTEADGVTYPATRCYYNGTTWVLSRHTGATLIPYALWTSANCTLDDCPSPADATGWAPTLGVGVATPTGTPVFTDDTDYSPDVTAAQLFADPANAYWGIQTDGTQRVGRQLSCEWYEITVEQVVGGTFADGVVTVDTFSTNDNYSWPPVLDTFELLDWDRRDGGTDIFPAVRMNPEGYSGPCKTVVTRTWSPTPFTIEAVTILQPTRIYYASPFFTMNVPECLHGLIAVQCDIGNTDPVYDENVGSTRYFSATGPPASGGDAANTWPSTITAYDDQVPFRGGYLRTVRVVHRPTIPTQVGWTTGT